VIVLVAPACVGQSAARATYRLHRSSTYRSPIERALSSVVHARSQMFGQEGFRRLPFPALGQDEGLKRSTAIQHLHRRVSFEQQLAGLSHFILVTSNPAIRNLVAPNPSTAVVISESDSKRTGGFTDSIGILPDLSHGGSVFRGVRKVLPGVRSPSLSRRSETHLSDIKYNPASVPTLPSQ